MTSDQPGTTQDAVQGDQHHGDEQRADVVDEHGHGHSVAAWAGVATCLAGFLILCLAVVFPSLLWGIIGGAVILASLVVSAALSRAGYGVKKSDGTPAGVRSEHGNDR
ncbi:MAG: HGxxPAAW family protein [Janthinobacterium lividum]